MRRRHQESFCVSVRVDGHEQSELVAAEAWDAGASGIEERSEEGGCTLLVYAAPPAVDAVREAVSGVAGSSVTSVQRVADTDWSEEWRRGLRPVVVGDRLVVRPSWIDLPIGTSAAAQLVIDPGQAFGTGAHVSTRLALEWIEDLSRRPGGLAAGTRVLDVGTGTGVLALAALALGAGHAVGLDLDPESGVAARRWAAHNGLDDRFRVFVGPLDALDAADFDCVVANLLKRELLPLCSAIATRTRRGGRAIFSGMLAAERDEVVAALGRAGFAPDDERRSVDDNGDTWISLLMSRA